MKLKQTRFTATFLAAAVLAAIVPFNMGGCSDVTSQVGGAVAGRQGAQLGGALGRGVESASMSEADEQAMGEAVSVTVTSRYPVVRDQRLNQYVTLVGLTVANASAHADANWLFAVVDTPDANAFSGPGGFIMVTRGLINQLHDESELAGVLAHEMSHVLEQHGLKAAKRAGVTSAGVDAFAALADSKDRDNAFSQLTGSVADTVLNKGYSREQEDEADARAVRLVINAGYDPTGYLNFLQRTAREQRGSGAGGVMSTHPGAGDRAKKVRKRIDEIAPAKQGAILRERFEKMTGQAK
jgi:predicted Zn-dependent protease